MFGHTTRIAARLALSALLMLALAACQDAGTGKGGSDGSPTGGGITGGDGSSYSEEPNALALKLTVSTPPNLKFFRTGEVIKATVTLADTQGNKLKPSDFSTLRLVISGPLDVTKTKTAAKLMGASTNRTLPVHHYVNMADPASSTRLSVSGNKVIFTSKLVSTEPAGTYTVGVWAVAKESGLMQDYLVKDIKIKVNAPEAYAVGGCADCHRGANSGKNYFAHIDPGFSPTGNFALDTFPVQNCKNCHNEDGYAAYQYCADTANNRPDATTGLCGDGVTSPTRKADPIVRRVHGVHHGDALKNPFNIDAVTGDFKDYTELGFPADDRSCTKCHITDTWKTKPSIEACTACHDNFDFIKTVAEFNADQPAYGTCTDNNGTSSILDDVVYDVGPATVVASGIAPNIVFTCDTSDGSTPFPIPANVKYRGEKIHPGGGLADGVVDGVCTVCHTATAIPTAHEITAATLDFVINVTMTAPANAQYYVAAETPVVTVEFFESDGVTLVDPTTILESNGDGAYLFVYGPRTGNKPVLTTAVGNVYSWKRANRSTAADEPWDMGAVPGTLTVAIDGGADIPVDMSGCSFSGASNSAATAAEVVTCLNLDATFAAAATASITGGPAPYKVVIKSDTIGSASKVNVTAGGANTVLAFTAGATTNVTPWTYPANEIETHNDALDDDPKATVTATNITYDLDALPADMEPGTYHVFVRAKRAASTLYSLAMVTFQIETATEDAKVAAGCPQCHEQTVMHGSGYPFNVDYCGACHDQDNQFPTSTAGWSTNQYGFGNQPISKRVHGVHFEHYVANPAEVFSGNDGAIIFPQDVRNCSKCHTDSSADLTSGSFPRADIGLSIGAIEETSGSWKSGVSRIPCSGCHNSTKDWGHFKIMTLDVEEDSDPLTPNDPWNGDELETCTICHGEDSEFSPANAHNISDPFVPPYVRDPE